jgi:hypothetical protein
MQPRDHRPEQHRTGPQAAPAVRSWLGILLMVELGLRESERGREFLGAGEEERTRLARVLSRLASRVRSDRLGEVA